MEDEKYESFSNQIFRKLMWVCAFITISCVILGFMEVYQQRTMKNTHYENACIAMENGNYKYAVQELEAIPDIESFHYQDAKDKLEEARYLYAYYEARNYMDDENYEEAIKWLVPILGYKDCEQLYQQCLDGYVHTYLNEHAPG